MATIADLSNVGSVLDKSQSIGGVVGMAALMIIFHFFNNYTTLFNWGWQYTEYEMTYTGVVMTVVLSQMAAGYSIVKVLDATMNTSLGFFYLYSHGSLAGDFISFYELTAVFLYITWAALISLVGFVMAGIAWSTFETREFEAQRIPLSGPFRTIDGYKFLYLGIIMSAGAWISSLALGDSSREMLGFFDAYNTKREAGQNYLISSWYVDDIAGTSLTYDLSYHTITLIGYFTVSTAIWLGSVIFGFVYLFEEPGLNPEVCDLDNVSINNYASIFPTFAKVKDYQSCVDNFQAIVDAFDLNKDGIVDPCEDAHAIYAFNKDNISKDQARQFNTYWNYDSRFKLCRKSQIESFYKAQFE